MKLAKIAILTVSLVALPSMMAHAHVTYLIADIDQALSKI